MLLAGLFAAADTAPSQRALIGPGDQHLQFSALCARASAAAEGLRARGITDGARAVVLVPPGPDFVVSIFALLASGGVPVLIDPGIGIRRVRRALDEVAPTALIGAARAHLARRALRWAPTARQLILTGADGTTAERASGATDTLATVERDGRNAIERGADGWTPRDHDDEAALLFTSGSTGPPKAVVYRHSHFAAQIRALQRRFQLAAGEINVATFPPFALFGPVLGMTTVLPEMDFTRPAAADPARLFALTNTCGANVMFASPALLDVLVAHGRTHGTSLPSVRLVLSAGAPVPAALAAAMRALLAPGGVVATPYGMTEALPVSTIDGDELQATANAHRPPRGVCVGRPLPDTSVAIIDVHDEPITELSDADRLSPGQIGELVVAGPQVTDAYIGRPAAMARAKTMWNGRTAHRTGDLAWRDPDGRLWFCGRTAHQVATADGPLHPLPIEQLVADHPAVRRAALVEVPGSTGREPVLIVQPDDAARRRLAAWWPGGLQRRRAFLGELRARLDATADGTRVTQLLLRRRFPVDARHNAKIGYEQLARWAAARRRLRPTWVGRTAFGGGAT